MKTDFPAALLVWSSWCLIFIQADMLMPPTNYYTLKLAMPIPIACENSPLRFNGTNIFGFTAAPYSLNDGEIQIAKGPRNGTFQVIPTVPRSNSLPLVLSIVDNGSPGGAELRSSPVDVQGDNWVQQLQNGTVMTWRAWSTIAIRGRQFLRHGYPPKVASPWDVKKEEKANSTRWVVIYSERTRGEPNRAGSYDVELAPLNIVG